MRDVTIHENMLLRRGGIEENCRLSQKYSICLLEEEAWLRVSAVNILSIEYEALRFKNSVKLGYWVNWGKL